MIQADVEHKPQFAKLGQHAESQGYAHKQDVYDMCDREILRNLFVKLYGEYDGSKRRGEWVHVQDGPYRLVLYMQKKQFVNLFRLTEEEQSQPDTHLDSSQPPYDITKLLVWHSELNEYEYECVLRVMKAVARTANAHYPSSFEAVQSTPVANPQFLHSDTVKFWNDMLAAISVVGRHDQNDDRLPLRTSTELLECQHRHISDFTTVTSFKKYVTECWEGIKREYAKTVNAGDYITSLSQYKETVSGRVVKSFKVEGADVTYFRITHPHRGPASKAVCYSFFADFPHESFPSGTSSGEPMHLENYQQVLRNITLDNLKNSGS
jgi:hypothetical protein